jgi:hypothetical protein
MPEQIVGPRDLELVLVVLVDVDQGITRQPDQIGIVVQGFYRQCAEEGSVLGRAMEVVAADPTGQRSLR